MKLGFAAGIALTMLVNQVVSAWFVNKLFKEGAW